MCLSLSLHELLDSDPSYPSAVHCVIGMSPVLCSGSSALTTSQLISDISGLPESSIAFQFFSQGGSAFSCYLGEAIATRQMSATV